MARKNYSKHQIIGDWKLGARLGKGGNGEVWLVHKQQEEGAIKLLKILGKISINVLRLK